MTDPIADFLTRIRNAIIARKAKVESPASKMRLRIAEILREEGFINGIEQKSDDTQGTIVLTLRYGADHRNAIGGIRRISRPGQRRYVNKTEIPKVRSGLGVSILTTSQGLMTDRSARKAGLGGELLCEVW